MPYIKTLKDRQDETVFPVTKADGVILNDNSSAQGRLGKALYQADTVGEIEVEAWVDTDSIIDEAVTEPKIADGAVTEDKIADDSISNDKLQDESVSLANLIWPAIMNRMYPVGSIYMSATLDTAQKVQTAMGGGTWVAWGAGKVPVGVNTSETEFDTVEKTGGSKSMQKHSHTRGTMEIKGEYYGDEVSRDCAVTATGAFQFPAGTSKVGHFMGGGYSYNLANGFNFQASRNWTGHTSEEGSGTSGNLQPYITCYMWKRTA